MENISIEFIINMVVLIGGIFALVKSNNDVRKEISDVRKELSDFKDESRKEMSSMRDEFRVDNTSIKIELVKLQHRFDKIEGKYTDLHAMMLEIKTQHDSQFVEIKTTIASQANKNEVINERLNQIQIDVETQKSLKDFIQGLTTAMKTPQQQL